MSPRSAAQSRGPAGTEPAREFADSRGVEAA
jgi:hypothetical protein